METKLKILTSNLDGLSPPLPQEYIEELERRFEIIYGNQFAKNPKEYEDIVAIVWRYGPHINKDLLDQLPNLKVVATVSVGYSHLDIPLIRSRGIKLAHTPNVLNAACAELGIALMISAARNIPRFTEEYRCNKYESYIPINDTTPQFSGSTLGILGMGRIGYTLAKQAKAFDVKILYHNRTRRSTADEQAVGATYYSSLHEMLPLCDFVMVMVNLTPETKHIMGAKEFQLMKKTAIISNCSRGGTVDQDALINALKSGEIYGAALDVTTPDPLPKNHELFDLPNVLLTPHISSQTTKTRLNMLKLAIDNMNAAIEGRPLPSEVPF